MNSYRKILSVAILVLVLNGAFFAITSISSAQNSYMTINSVEYNEPGYKGSNVIYPAVTYAVNKPLCGVGQNSNSTNLYCAGVIDSVHSSMKTGVSDFGNSFMSNYIYSQKDGLIPNSLKIEITTINSGNESYLSLINQPQAEFSPQVIFIDNSVTTQNIVAKSCFLAGLYYGVNLSYCGASTANNSCWIAIQQTASLFLSKFFPGYACSAYALSMLSDFSGPVEPTASSSSLITCGQGTIYKDTPIINQTVENSNVQYSPAQDRYLSVSVSTISIPESELAASSNGKITVGGLSCVYGGGDAQKGASSQVTFDLVPTVSLCGVVYENKQIQYGCTGVRAVNTPVYLTQCYNGVNTVFCVMTNSSGNWQFFAEPGASYTLSNLNPQSYQGSAGYYSMSLGQVSSSDIGQQIIENSFNDSMTSIYGTVTVDDNGQIIHVSGASITATADGSLTYYATTNSAGNYNVYVPMNTDVTVYVYAGSYSFSSQSVETGTSHSIQMNFVDTISTSSGGGGGGGCVLYGTNITLANGSTVQVQNLYTGEKILSYNTNQDKFFTNKVKQIIITQNVTSIIRIDNFISLSGPTVQPVYVQTTNGTDEWVFLGQITDGMSLYNPINNTWVKVTNITIVIGSFTVYEVIGSREFWDQGHKRSDYIANGILVDRKISNLR